MKFLVNISPFNGHLYVIELQKCEHVIDDMYVIRRPNWFISAIIFQLTSHNHFDKFMRFVVD